MQSNEIEIVKGYIDEKLRFFLTLDDATAATAKQLSEITMTRDEAAKVLGFV